MAALAADATFIVNTNTMNSDLFFRLFFASLFVGNLLVGLYVLRNEKAVFETTSGFHTDTKGARDYNRLQVWATWAHVALLTGAFAIFY